MYAFLKTIRLRTWLWLLFHNGASPTLHKKESFFATLFCSLRSSGALRKGVLLFVCVGETSFNQIILDPCHFIKKCISKEVFVFYVQNLFKIVVYLSSFHQTCIINHYIYNSTQKKKKEQLEHYGLMLPSMPRTLN